jgi:hypothetical protein
MLKLSASLAEYNHVYNLKSYLIRTISINIIQHGSGVNRYFAGSRSFFLSAHHITAKRFLDMHINIM